MNPGAEHLKTADLTDASETARKKWTGWKATFSRVISSILLEEVTTL